MCATLTGLPKGWALAPARRERGGHGVAGGPRGRPAEGAAGRPPQPPKAERHADGGGQQALGAASDVAVAAVRLMLQAPADGARQRAGLEALKLVTAVKARCAAALDAGAAPVVQRAVAAFADDAAIVDLGRVVAQRPRRGEPQAEPAAAGRRRPDRRRRDALLGGASSLSSGDAIKRPTRGSSTRLERRVQQDAALFRSYAVSEDNARRLLEMFPGDDEPRRSRVRDRRDRDPYAAARASAAGDTKAPSGGRRRPGSGSTTSPRPSPSSRRRVAPEHELALLENRSVGTRVTFDGESLSQSAAHETVSLEEQKTLEGSEASPFPLTSIEEDMADLTEAVGGPYCDIDAELFLSAHGLAPRIPRKKTVRLLERLFAPPVGTLTLDQARFLSALDFTRRERNMIAATRAADGGGGGGAGTARGWTAALSRVTGGELVDDPVVEDEEARLRARRRDFTVMGTARNEAALRAGDAAVQGHVLLKNDDVSGAGPLGRSPAKQERPGPALDPIVVKPSEANRLNHASAVIREQSKVAAAARRVITDAAPRDEPPALAAAGAHLVHATHDGTANGALKVADPMPLYDLLRLLDPKERGYCKASEFKTAIRCAAGNALSDKEIDHLAGHYAIGGGHAEDEEPDERLGLRTEGRARSGAEFNHWFGWS
ncbi:hypothetical protein JL721_2633 [Aureococcus anophagefferens]|nr:hypothetical protein JL721_2633 [Aureococcus anophagefferens]